eukprot:scaffold18210_cov98-Isochrysis_galbana.AAC.4
MPKGRAGQCILVVSAHALSRAPLCQGPAKYSRRCTLWGQQASLAGQNYTGIPIIGPGPRGFLYLHQFAVALCWHSLCARVCY